MLKPLVPPFVRGSIVSLLVLVSFLLVTLSPLAPRAQATSFTGLTQGLVNLGQPARESSSAIPIFGFSMTASGAGERLIRLTVTFSGTDWQAGNNRDLRTLDRDPRNSGVGIFRDTGTSDDALDASDFPVTMAAAPTWSGSDVIFDFTASGGTIEPIPTTVTGSYHWIIALRTAADNPTDLIDGERITSTVRSGQIIATSGAGFVSQPAANVNANDLTVDVTKGLDIVGGSGFPWIGPTSALVNSKAVLGIHVIDGGTAPNHGIQDTMTSLAFDIVQTGGAVSAGDFKPITTNPATSGIALYRDNTTAGVNDQWDAFDVGITPASLTPMIFPAGSRTTFIFTFSGAGVDVPNAGFGAFDFFVVVRTNNIATWDEFHMELPVDAIHLRGLLAPMGGAVEGNLRAPQTQYFTTDVIGDATPPMTTSELWYPTSNYLFPSGLTLHFGHAMTSPQSAYAAGFALDQESGLANATYTNEPSLAYSPPMQLLPSSGWQLYFGEYRFDNTSLGTSSPVDVTIYDRVGNSIKTSQEGKSYRYVYEASKVIVLPDPGWQVTGGYYAPWVDPAGKLWFPRQVYSTDSAQISVLIASLSGAELTSAAASSEPTLGGPSPTNLTFGAGTFNSGWATTYTMNASATDANSPVTITAWDNLGNVGTATFAYGLDANGPSVTVVSPSQGSTLSGNVVLKALASDDHTQVQYVTFYISGLWGAQGVFDGTYYMAQLSSALIPDGQYTLSVIAADMVGNTNVVGSQVTFLNGPDVTAPKVKVVQPLAGVYAQGPLVLNASASDDVGVTGVDYKLVRSSDGTQMTSGSLSASGGGYYGGTLNTAAYQDGDYALTFTGKDAAGNLGFATVDIHIDNIPPVLAIITPVANSFVSALYSLSVSAQGMVASADYMVKRASNGSVVFSGPLALADTGYYQSTLDTTALADGDYTLVVTASDVTGLNSTASVPFAIDNNPPTLQVSSPKANAYLSGSIALNVIATDAHLSGIDYSVDSGPWFATSTALDTTTLADGWHTLTVRADDRAGRSTTWEAKVVVDNTAPSASLSSLAAGQTLQGLYTYRVYAWDAVGIQSVTLTVAGGKVDMAYDAQSGYYEYTVDTQAWTDGSYAAQATVTDLSGKQTTTASTTFTVKNKIDQPLPSYVTLFSAMVPMLSFLFALLAFGVIVGLMKSGAISRWMHRGKEESMLMVEGPPPTPPRPPAMPPPGAV